MTFRLHRYGPVWMLGGAVLFGACGESGHPSSPPASSGKSGGGAANAGKAGTFTGGRAGSGGSNAGTSPGATGGSAGESDGGSSGESGGPSAGGSHAGNGAGTGGSAASAGQSASGSGGESGAGVNPVTCHAHAAEAPSLPDPTDLDAALVARAAAIVGSCMPDDGVNRNATHFWSSHRSAARPWFRFAAELDCLAHADCGCGAVEECLGFYAGPARGTCEAGCRGALWTACEESSGPTIEWTFDCGKLGLDCDDAAGCVDEPTPDCGSLDPGQVRCTSDGRQETCSAGALRHTPPCDSLGLTCSDDLCTGDGDECVTDYSQQGSPEQIVLQATGCDGDTLTACENEHLARIDCMTQGPGFSCQSVGGRAFCGLASECEPADDWQNGDFEASCNGSVLTFCNAGRVEQLDCTTLGFESCAIEPAVGHYGCTPTAFD